MENKDNLSREKTGKIASAVGILANIFLALGKIIVGLIFGFMSVLADGLNNLSDCGSSIISLISFKLSSKPADEEHPYGHERIEYISSMIVAFLILLIAFELVMEAIGKIINPTKIEFSYVIILVLVASIIIKALMFVYYRIVAKKINSELLKATSVDCISDSISTSAVLISIVVGKLINYNIDGYISIVVALFIAYSGINILKETISHLIGQAPDKELIAQIKTRILNHTEVLGIHDLNVYSYGPNKFFASVHIELDSSANVLDSHELIDEIEREFIEETNIVLTGHHDPIVIDDEETNTLRKQIGEIVKALNPEFSMHDFRMVKATNFTNLIFEVAIPFNTKKTIEDIKNDIKNEILKLGENYRPVIMVEKQIYR
ncbi:MAG: cation transporter [Clostridia bacterium]|nr:cation transporter [Clostridia bacterium]